MDYETKIGERFQMRSPEESNAKREPNRFSSFSELRNLRKNKSDFDGSLYDRNSLLRKLSWLDATRLYVTSLNEDTCPRKYDKTFANQSEFGDIGFCYWFPELFGIDEEVMPSSDDENLFEEIYNNKELDERAKALTESQLKGLKVGSKVAMTDDEIRELWKREQVPKYGRRARQKPILERENNIKFECNCDISRSFSRQYVSHFGGGSANYGEELRTPHFVAFWEDFRDQEGKTADMHEWSELFASKREAEEEEKEVKEKGLLFRPVPKFPGSCRTEIEKFKQQLLGSFRPLDCREIRRFRMSFPEALYLELQEDRYFDSASFFKNLIIKDYFASKNSDYIPSLRHNKGRMKYLVKFLKIAEKFSRRKEFHKEAIVLLKSGKYFNDHNEAWWWLAEELYKKAVKVSRQSVIDGGKSEAIARYILGTFFLEFVNKVQSAQEHLSEARELSAGKDWNAGTIMKNKQEPVYKECSNYLCQALIASSRELRKNGKPEQSLPLIHRSYKLCLESRTFRRDIEMETYYELGMTYQALEMLDSAKIAFKKFIEIAKLENYPRSVCDGYLELAITYRSEGDLNRCHHNLMSYLETAESNQDENLIAFGNRYLGEYHLNNGDSKIASEFFQKSFVLFHKQCTESLNIPLAWWKPEHFHLPHDVELSRVLKGLASGELITKPICQLILRARGVKNTAETLKLINWKNKKENLTDLADIHVDESLSVFEAELIDIEIPIAPNTNSSEILSEINSDQSTEETFYKTVRFALDEPLID